MTSPGWLLARRAVLSWLLLVAFVVPLVLGISAAEAGGPPTVTWGPLLQLLGPGMAAAAVALTVAGSRTDGSWDGWTALGNSTGRRLLPLGVCAAVGLIFLSGLVVQPLGARLADGPLALPAPVAPEARFWLEPSGWEIPDLAPWKMRPATLSTPELVHRLGQNPPRGARRGSDMAELLLRGSGAVLWLLAIPLGTSAALRRTKPRDRRGGAPAISASLEAVAWILVFQVCAFVAAVYASSMM